MAFPWSASFPISKRSILLWLHNKALNIYNNYVKVMLISDFNAEKVETVHKHKIFLSQHDPKNLRWNIFKNPKQPSCVNLFLTLSFQHAISVSDFHNVILTVQSKPREIK